MNDREPCPKPGLCMTLESAYRVHDDAIKRHETALGQMANDMQSIKQEVHTLVSRSNERERTSTAHGSQMIGIAALVALQLCATVWWGSRLQSTVENMTVVVADHEQRIRQHASYINGQATAP
jgi:ferric-dicitrate binding protein FerR (iron transport regulator)